MSRRSLGVRTATVPGSGVELRLLANAEQEVSDPGRLYTRYASWHPAPRTPDQRATATPRVPRPGWAWPTCAPPPRARTLGALSVRCRAHPRPTTVSHTASGRPASTTTSTRQWSVRPHTLIYPTPCNVCYQHRHPIPTATRTVDAHQYRPDEGFSTAPTSHVSRSGLTEAVVERAQCTRA